MAVARNADGRMEVFARGSDRALIHNYQVGPNQGWAQWSSLGGRLQCVPAVGRNADGRLEVFAVGDNNAVWHIWQTVPNGGWSEWRDFGGRPRRAPFVGHNADGRLEVFAEFIDGYLYQKWQTAPNNGWSDWHRLGRPPGVSLDAPFAIQFPRFDVCRNADGRLELFVTPNDGALWHIWQTVPNGGWSEWHSLGKIDWEWPFFWGPVAARNLDGRLEVFVTTRPGHSTFRPGLELFHIWQTAPNSGWSSWRSLGGTWTSAPAVSRTADGRLEVFARGLDMVIWHIWQTAPNNGWSSWHSLGGMQADLGPGFNINNSDGAPTVGQNADGRLQLFVRRRGLTGVLDGVLAHIWQARIGWSEWKQLGLWTVHREGLGRGLIEPF